MPKQKTDKPALTEADENLIRRVDAMMGAEPADGSSRLPDKTAGKLGGKPVSAPELPKAADKAKPENPPPEKPEDDDPNAEKPRKEKLLKIGDSPTKTEKPAPEPEPEPKPSSDPPAEEPQSEESEVTEADVPDPAIDLDDAQTDKAVDDIASADADTILALQDLKSNQAAEAVEPPPSSVGKRIFLLILLAVVVVGGLIVYGYVKL